MPMVIATQELIVRGWLANLAAPVYGDDEHLLDGWSPKDKCDVGIAASSAIAGYLRMHTRHRAWFRTGFRMMGSCISTPAVPA